MSFGLYFFVVPGFIAWGFYKARRRKSDARAADAIAEILAFSVFNQLVWFWRPWAVWPTTPAEAGIFAIEVFLSPLALALAFQGLVWLATWRNLIASPYERAWDFLFGSLAVSDIAAKNGLFLILTLKGGTKIGGVYTLPGYASLYPYDRDLFLGALWVLEDGVKPLRAVVGSIGMYVDRDEIATIEVLDYSAVESSVTENHNEREEGSH